MFTAMGQVPPGQADDLVAAMARHVEQELPAGRLVGWIVEQEGRPVAGGVLVLKQTAPALGFHPATTAMTLTLDIEDRP